MIEDLELSQTREASDLLVYDQLKEARDAIEKAVLELGDVNTLVEVGFHPVRRDASKFSVRPEFRKAISKERRKLLSRPNQVPRCARQVCPEHRSGDYRRDKEARRRVIHE